MNSVMFATLPWIQLIGPSVYIIGVLVVALEHRRTYRSVRKEIDQLRLQMAEMDSLRYRMDVFEGKHLRARNLGMGLPQPRKRDTDERK